jgi:hypothetical protein
MASVLRCFRGSYRWHATEGFHGNKGEPSGSSLACKVRQSRQGEGDLMTWRQSDWLIVLGGRESRLHGEAASGRGVVRRIHGLHTTGGFGLLCNEKNRQPWKRDSNE